MKDIGGRTIGHGEFVPSLTEAELSGFLLPEMWLVPEAVSKGKSKWPWGKHPMVILVRFLDLADSIKGAYIEGQPSDNRNREVIEYRLLAQMIYQGLINLELERIEDQRELVRIHEKLGIDIPEGVER